jgi:hypothetical protein
VKKREGKKRARSRRVCFEPSEAEYQTLSALAKFHQSTVGGLVERALSSVIEKYRVLRALDRRLGQVTQLRRRRV